jgi:hypothetical protein
MRSSVWDSKTGQRKMQTIEFRNGYWRDYVLV